MSPRSVTLGACHFDLFIGDGEARRAEYAVEVLYPGPSAEFVLTRTWPQFLEANWPLIPKDYRGVLKTSLVAILAAFEAGRSLELPTTPDPAELHACRFTDRLIMGRKMFIQNSYTDFLAPHSPVSVYSAVVWVATLTLAIALTKLPRSAADELKFFLAYGFAKWDRKGHPRPWRQTWDFGNVAKMIAEYSAWHPK